MLRRVRVFAAAPARPPALRGGSGPEADAATAAFESAWQTNYTEAFPAAPEGDAVRRATEALSTYAGDGDADEPPAGLRVMRNADTAAGWALLPQPAWPRLPGSLAWLCRTDPGCVGFNSLGELKARVDGAGERFDADRDVRAKPGVDLFLLPPQSPNQNRA